MKHENFKTCNQSGFCKRNRALADSAAEAASSWKSPYELDATTVKLAKGKLTGTVYKTLADGEKRVLPLAVSFLASGVARVTLDEELRQKGNIELRHDSKVRKERYDEAAYWAVVGGLEANEGAAVSPSDAGRTVVKYGPESAYEAVITHSPFRVEFRRDGEAHVIFNEQGLLNLEHWRAKVEPPPVEEGAEAPLQNSED
ncbi:MAG: hypothetical protein INR71_08680, partial [Terriglobus roseus]|nr:hypothetical protein [Terriglobus roseus]